MSTPFGPNSRYFKLPTAQLQLRPDGPVYTYVRRRFLPQADRLALLREYVVNQGDRLDNVTANFIGDPEQFWRLCDANNAMIPNELVATVGRKLRITLPQGIPGFPNA
jgi:hypothetical protein